MRPPTKRYRYLFLRDSIVLSVTLSLILLQCKDSIVDAPSADLSFGETTIPGMTSSAPLLPSGALYDIQLPDQWDDLVIYNHGYVNPQQPISVPDEEVEGQSVAEIVNQLGFAYAATSYRANGLVGPEAVEDVVELVETFISLHGEPDRIYLVGVSEGALVTTLAVEQHGGKFSGGIAACGPVGDFERQINYLGDFHVLFNHFFPDLIPGDPTGIPEATISQWLADNSALQQKVADAIYKNPSTALTLLNVADVPVDDPSDVEELRSTIFSLLRYNVLATNNANQRLNGYPYSNAKKMYRGTGSILEDLKLNHYIERFTADASALSTIDDEFQTSGDISRPLVMIHTTRDQEVPYWHERLYRRKAFLKGKFLYHSNIRISRRYGHCNFHLSELLTGFSVMVLKVTLRDLIVPISIFETDQQKQEFIDLSREQGIDPKFREESLPVLQ
jgi:pimeloyl-ACP methyl ester carboxylesterase